VQGAVGYGLALMVVPVLALVRPEALPAVVLLLAMPTAGFKVVREWRFADARGLVWILSGCLAGALGGWGHSPSSIRITRDPRFARPSRSPSWLGPRSR
jgi:uncharacterized membrane protein YfcA